MTKSARRTATIRDGWSTPGPHADPAEVAEYLGVHPDTIRRWHRQGALRGAKITGAYRGPIRFRKVDVEAWAEAKKAS